MYKFMTVSFLALGVAFYEMSGGADFVPEQRLTVADADVAVETPVVQTTDVDVSRSNAASLISLNPQVTTVALDTTPTPQPAPAAEPVAVAEPAVVVTQDPVAEIVEVVTEPLDIRAVAGSRVNMRQGPGTNFSVLDTLDGGTQTEVLEVNDDGWARIQVVNTGQVGWMAERLLTDG